MSNVLKVSYQEAIRSLHEKGWSQRRIARELGINGRTVRRYIGAESKYTTISTPGAQEEWDSKCSTISTPGSEDVSSCERLGRKSRCEPFEAAIGSKMEAGLSAQRIYQDLEEKGFLGSYQSVKRFVRRLRQRQPQRVWRMECQPGEEMQVDFGLGAPIEQGGGGKTRRSWVLRAVLSYSRNGIAAIKAGFLVLYRSVFDLVRELSLEATQAGESRLLGKYLKPDLLIIDDMGLKILPPKSGEILLEIIMRRYENRSTLMTSNRPIEEWGKLLSDVPAASAILDRLLHHVEVITITGRSYRLQGSANQRAFSKPKSSPQQK